MEARDYILKAQEDRMNHITNSFSNADELLKAGEGSRGGHVVGHTKSGDPIYESTNQRGSVKVPANASTVTNKVMKENPWRRGKEISEMITQNWTDIASTANGAANKQDFTAKFTAKPYVKEICKQLSLADQYFTSKVIKMIV